MTPPLRHGIVILPEDTWRESAPRWRAAEQLGFDHAWTYDHLVWAGLPDAPWFAAVPTLAAAAGVTSTIGLGTFVSSPNYRHPYTFARDVLTLDDLSEGRFLCGLGTGGDVDSRILGEELTVRERVARFHEFVPLLDRLLREDHVEHTGDWYALHRARTLPGPVRHRVPLLVAAEGPRSLRLAATVGDGWITTGRDADDLDGWFDGVAALADAYAQACAEAGREPGRRVLMLDGSPRFSLGSAALHAEMSGRAAELGFTDAVTHWPRPEGPYAGEESVLEEVATRLRGPAPRQAPPASVTRR